MERKSRKVNKKSRFNQSMREKTLEILRSLVNGLTIEQITRKFDIREGTVYKHKKNFISNDLIDRRLALTEKGRILLDYGNSNNTFRLENVVVKIWVPKLYQEKFREKHRNLLSLRQISFQDYKLGKETYEFFAYDRATIRTFHNSILIRMPPLRGKNRKEISILLLDLIMNYVQKLERIFNIELVHSNILKMEIITEEIAHINNALAQILDKKGYHLYFRDDEERLRLKIDFSKNLPELEGVSPNFAEPDLDRINKQIGDIIENNPPTNSELASHIKQVADMQIYFNRNIEGHFTVLGKMCKVLEKIENRLDRESKI